MRSVPQHSRPGKTRKLNTTDSWVATELERAPATASGHVVHGTVSDEDEFAGLVTPAVDVPALCPCIHLPARNKLAQAEISAGNVQTGG
jgi:hypothetical protein